VEDLVNARAALTPRRTDASKAGLDGVAFTDTFGNNFGTLNAIEDGATHLSQVKGTNHFFVSGGESVVILVVANASG
jgi:hypothetical protein